MNLRRLFAQFSLAAVAVLASVGIQAFAFTEPTTAPPQANAYAPINTGPSAQYKTGSLLLNTAGNSVGFATHNATELLGNTTVGTTSQPANLNVVGTGSFAQNIGTRGFSPTSGLPTGWGGGVHTWDVYAEGTIGSGQGGALKAYLNNTGAIAGATLNLSGNAHANDFCTNGGKCLSSVGGGISSYNQLPSGASAGYCTTGCGSVIAPAVCTGSSTCSCATGFRRITTGGFTHTIRTRRHYGAGYITTYTYSNAFSCIKN